MISLSWIDSVEKIKDLITNANTGSLCYCVENNDVYLFHSKNWILFRNESYERYKRYQRLREERKNKLNKILD